MESKQAYPFNEVPFDSINKDKFAFSSGWKQYSNNKYTNEINDNQNRFIVTGTYDPKNINSLQVIDLDVNDTEDFNLEMFLEGSKLPKTHIVKTPSGGVHLYYILPIGEQLNNTSYKFKAEKPQWCKGLEGIDRRGQGGIVFAPPTEWTEGDKLGAYISLDNDYPTEIKKSVIVDFYERLKKYNKKPKTIINKSVAQNNRKDNIIAIIKNISVPEGYRSKFDMSLTGYCKNMGLTENEALQVLENNFSLLNHDKLSTLAGGMMYWIRSAYDRDDHTENLENILSDYAPSLFTYKKKIIDGETEEDWIVTIPINYSIAGETEIDNVWIDNTNKGVFQLRHGKDGITKKLISQKSIKNIQYRINPISFDTIYIFDLINERGIINKFTNTKLSRVFNDVSEESGIVDRNKCRQAMSIIHEHFDKNGFIEYTHQETMLGFTLKHPFDINNLNNNELQFVNNHDEFKIQFPTCSKDEAKEWLKQTLLELNWCTKNLIDPTHFATGMKYYISAPFGWVRRLLGLHKEYLNFVGLRDSGKSTIADIGHGLYKLPDEFNTNSESIKTESRILNLFNSTSFVITIDEIHEILHTRITSKARNTEVAKSTMKAITGIIRSSTDHNILRTIRGTDQKIAAKNLSIASLSGQSNNIIDLSEKDSKRIKQLLFDIGIHVPKSQAIKIEFKFKKQEIINNAWIVGKTVIDNLNNWLSVEQIQQTDLYDLGEYIWSRLYDHADMSIPDWVNDKPEFHNEFEAHGKKQNLTRKNAFIDVFKSVIQDKAKFLKIEINMPYPSSWLEIIQELHNQMKIPEDMFFITSYHNKLHINFLPKFIEHVHAEENQEMGTLKSIEELFYGSKYDSVRGKRVIKMVLNNFTPYLDSTVDLTGNIE